MRKRVWWCLYNLDRAVAVLFGADPQATISSEACRRQHTARWAKWLVWVLEKIDPGHCDEAIRHAERLEAADDHMEK